MLKKMILGAAMLAMCAPALADPHRKVFKEGRHHAREAHGHHGRHGLARDVTRHGYHHHHHAPRRVVVVPPAHVYYAPGPVYYAPAPVYYARPPVVYAPAAPYGGISIRFNFPL